MRKLHVLFAIFVLFVSTVNSPILFSSIAFAANEANQTSTTSTQTTASNQTTAQPSPTNLCTGVSCQSTTLTCPDGFVSSCAPTCDSSTGKCGTCAPSCAGHDLTRNVTSTTPSPVVNCSVTRDGVCPIGCAAGSDYDCCVNAGKQWIDGKGCYDIVPGTTEQQKTASCSATPDNVCPIGCAAGSDYDCCKNAGKEWIDGKGCVDYSVVCPAPQQQNDLIYKCKAEGGNVVSTRDSNGCVSYDCRFDNREIKANPISGYQICPKEEELNVQIKKCEASGLNASYEFEGGCKLIKCFQGARPACNYVPDSLKEKIGNECSSRGLPVVKLVDNSGCVFYKCSESQQAACQHNVPPEAYNSCNSKGGEMVVKTDNQGCVAFAQCVTQGDEKNAYVAPVQEVPDTTVLLSLAIKLDQLKIQLKGMSADSKEIAKFYASTGSLDEERYNRVSSMLDAAANKVDEIKSEIKSHADSFTTDDIVQIKSDVKYLKEVTLKDILYVMLSSSDDLKQTLEASKKISTNSSIEEVEKNAKDCGTDGTCFDTAIRTCKPVTFQSGGSSGVVISITGLKDDKCNIHVTMQSSNNIPQGYSKDTFFMDCSLANYALGIKGPNDILPYCTGPMAKVAGQFGGSQTTGSQSFPPPEGGPGGCKTQKDCAIYCIDNYDACKQWVKDHPAYGTLPPKDALMNIASGRIVLKR